MELPKKDHDIAISLSFFLAAIAELYLGDLKRGILILIAALTIAIYSYVLSGLTGLATSIISLTFCIYQTPVSHRFYKGIRSVVV